jgi:thiamine pyrophosphate-dependent acetolactate synthase large subunit-like protein
MAPGLPYTIANQVAHPGRQCIAFVGDGGFAMLMAEFGTACRYGLPIKVVINNNASLGQIMWEQLVLGYPEFGIRFDRPPDFAPWAEACGGRGIKVEKADEVEKAIEDALSYPGPALVDVLVNPDEPPMPGKVQYEQAKGFMKAFLSGQPRRATIASTLWRDKITEMRA